MSVKGGLDISVVKMNTKVTTKKGSEDFNLEIKVDESMVKEKRKLVEIY